MQGLQEKSISVKTVITFISVIVILINSGYYRSTTTDSYIPLILLIALTAFCLLFMYKYIRKKLSFVAVILTVSMALSVLVNFSSANLLSAGRVAVTMLCSYILMCTIPLNEFSKFFTGLIRALIIVSVAFNLLLLLGVGGFPTVNGYYDLFIVTQRVGMARVCGIFWEPGVFATMIIVAMLFEYYLLDKKVRPLGMIIYVVGLFATQSTAGLVILFVVLLGIIWKKVEDKKRKNLYTIIFIVIAVIIFLSLGRIIDFLVKISPELFGKLVETESNTTSTRLNGPLINLSVFAEKPLFGWGFTGSASEILKRMFKAGAATVDSQTSTSTQIMAAIGVGGLMYSLAFILPIFSKKKLPNVSTALKIILAICMLLIVNKEPHIFIVSTWMLMFYMNEVDTKLSKKDVTVKKQKNITGG